MKLRFELRRANIEALYSKLSPNFLEVLALVSQIWAAADKIYFYFDQDQLIIYPEEKGGFDKVFARIHIHNQRSGEVGHSGSPYLGPQLLHEFPD